MSRFWIAMVLAGCAAGCRTASLSNEGASVAVAPEQGSSESDLDHCQVVASQLIGRGGGTFGGSFISNEELIEYALNDLRNQAAAKGANRIAHDPPQMGGGEGTTSTVTVTGVGYYCPGDSQTLGTSGGNDSANLNGSTPPTQFAGFTFGESREGVQRQCEAAGHGWQLGTDAYECSGALRNVGATSPVHLQFCEGLLCSVAIHVELPSATESIARYRKVLAQLEQQHGLWLDSDDSVIRKCEHDARSDDCLRDTGSAASARWRWRNGTNLVVRLATPVGAVPALIVTYGTDKPVDPVAPTAARKPAPSSTTPDATESSTPASSPVAAASRCIPGQSIACVGRKGCSGYQVCQPDASSLGPCICD